MTMEPFFEELKRAREARKISLSDIADVTLINIRFLEAIEQGNTAMLPEAYMRAFIREYATVVGLDPDDVIRRYEQRSASRPVQKEAPQAEAPAEKAAEPLPAVARPGHRFLKPGIVGGAALGVAMATLVIILWNLTGNKPSAPTQEIPFQSVITENTQRLTPPPPSQSVAETAPEIRPPADSMILHAQTTDSVWVRITLDQQQPQEYLFRPGARTLWKARDRFRLTIGNAGAIEFALNQKKLGALGARGAVIRDVDLTREMLTSR